MTKRQIDNVAYSTLAALLNKEGLARVDFDESESFGDFYETWKSTSLKIRVSRSSLNIEISPSDVEEWWDLELHKVLILKKEDDLNKPFSFEKMMSFLERDVAELKKLYELGNAAKTQVELIRLGSKRAKILFPNQFN